MSFHTYFVSQDHDGTWRYHVVDRTSGWNQSGLLYPNDRAARSAALQLITHREHGSGRQP